MWNHETEKDYQSLVAFWDQVFSKAEEKKQDEEFNPEDGWKKIAYSPKLNDAAASLGKCSKVLDYGCGSGWAGLNAAKAGCPDVTAVDVQMGSVNAAKHNIELYKVSDAMHAECVSADWLSEQQEGIYDGFFCSNVIDVVPEEVAETIIRESARVTTPDASVIIGMNYCMSVEKAKDRGYELKNGNAVYIDGILRLVSRTDEEWTEIFSRYYEVERLEYYRWPNEEKDTRRIFYLRKKA